MILSYNNFSFNMYSWPLSILSFLVPFNFISIFNLSSVLYNSFLFWWQTFLHFLFVVLLFQVSIPSVPFLCCQNYGNRAHLEGSTYSEFIYYSSNLSLVIRIQCEPILLNIYWISHWNLSLLTTTDFVITNHALLLEISHLAFR